MSNLKLICFDLDHTLIYDIHSVLFPCLLNGKYLEAREIDRLEECGKVNWIDADFQRALLLRGLDEKRIQENFEFVVKPIKNIRKTIEELNKRGYKTLLITAGPIQVARVAAQTWGISTYYGSDYEVDNGIFTGNINKHLSEYGKLECLKDYCSKNNILSEQCLAVGDGASDIAVFGYCGNSIAINYSTSVVGKANNYINTEDIYDIMMYID